MSKSFKNLRNCALVLSLITILMSVFLLVQSDAIISEITVYLVKLAASVAALVYGLHGCNKSGSVYLKLFVGTLALNALFGVLDLANTDEIPLNAVAVFGITLVFGLLCSLVTAVNLGKSLSTKLSYAVFLILLALTIFSIVVAPTLENIIRVVSTSLLGLLLVMYIQLKYLDKDARGTK